MARAIGVWIVVMLNIPFRWAYRLYRRTRPIKSPPFPSGLRIQQAAAEKARMEQSDDVW